MASIQSGGYYQIINVKAGTALDLSGTDGHSIIGWTPHGGDNQKWHLENRDGRWVFRSVKNGKYIGLAGSLVADATPLTAVDNPFHWDIYNDDEVNSAFRIFVPGQPRPINVDLSDNGNPTPGTPVHLWEKTTGRNQVWYFNQV